jgi:hypothetical protein
MSHQSQSLLLTPSTQQDTPTSSITPPQEQQQIENPSESSQHSNQLSPPEGTVNKTDPSYTPLSNSKLQETYDSEPAFTANDAKATATTNLIEPSSALSVPSSTMSSSSQLPATEPVSIVSVITAFNENVDAGNSREE